MFHLFLLQKVDSCSYMQLKYGRHCYGNGVSHMFTLPYIYHHHYFFEEKRNHEVLLCIVRIWNMKYAQVASGGNFSRFFFSLLLLLRLLTTKLIYYFDAIWLINININGIKMNWYCWGAYVRLLCQKKIIHFSLEICEYISYSKLFNAHAILHSAHPHTHTQFYSNIFFVRHSFLVFFK